MKKTGPTLSNITNVIDEAFRVMRQKLYYRHTQSPKCISIFDMQAIETILVKMVARTFADRPELFGLDLKGSESNSKPKT